MKNALMHQIIELGFTFRAVGIRAAPTLGL